MIEYGLIFIFLSFFLLVYAVGTMLTYRRRNVLRRIDNLADFYDESNPVDPEKMENGKDRLGSKSDRESFLSRYNGKLEIELAKADLLLHPQEYILFIAILSIILAVLFYLLSKSILTGFLGILLGVILSKLLINVKKSQRITKLSNQLVDTIILISNGLKAGYSFFQAADMVAREMKPPMGDEFKKLIRQINLGMTVEDALKKLGERVESQDMDLVITAILIQRQIGGNLAEVLDNITDTIRARVRMKREIKAKTSQGRLSGIILILLPPAIVFFLSILNPQFIGLLVKDSMGLLITCIAGILQILGVYMIIKIVNIDV